MSGVPRPGLAAQIADRPLLEVRNRPLVLLAVMMVSLVQFFDATIANVALPHMRAELGASPESISWVLTSFIIAGAIATPITGWLSDRVGSRNLFLGSTVAFIVASAACGASSSLAAMVVFRFLQGLAAAFIGPLTQIIMFDVSPPSKQASTMSSFGMLVMVAPITGPFIGGFLTDTLNWRWIYYVNLPIGIPALAILWFTLPSRPVVARALDKGGFAALAMGLAALQLLLDRGEQNDWFESTETVIEAVTAAGMLWMFFIQNRYTNKPLFNAQLLRNPNFAVGCCSMLVLGVTNVALSAVLPTMYQTIYHFPVMMAGLMMAPRGFGVIITTLIVNRLMRVVDYRYIISFGYIVTAGSLWIMTTWSPDMDWHPIVLASFVQGLGLGCVFTPMNMIAFGALPPALRPDGASLLSLFRNMGGSLGISIIVTMMARNQQVSHSDLTAHITGMTQAIAPGNLGMIEGMIARQSAMIAYLDNFKMIAIVLTAVAVLPLLLKRPHGGEFSGSKVALAE